MESRPRNPEYTDNPELSPMHLKPMAPIIQTDKDKLQIKIIYSSQCSIHVKHSFRTPRPFP